MVRCHRVVFAILAALSCFTTAYAQTTRVSISSDGTQADNGTNEVVSSADGRFVAFASYASNLVMGDTNNQTDIFVRDRLLGRTVRVSESSAGDQATQGLTDRPLISADGRFVAFFSTSAGLVAGDGPFTEDVFVRDRDVDGDQLYDEPGQVQTTRVSVRSDGNPGECQPSFPEPCSIGQDTQLVAMSDDGRHVVMHTWRVLEANDTNGFQDLYMHDRLTRRTVRLTSTSGESLSPTGFRSVSRDGRFVLAAISGVEPRSVVLDRNTNGNDAFDEPGDTTVSPVPLVAPGRFGFGLAISDDGALVVQNVFDSTGSPELWITHRIGMVSRRLSVVAQALANGVIRISSDNRRVAFATTALSAPPNVELVAATFDADGDGHLDDQGSIATVSLGAPLLFVFLGF